jgi:hypothetical protein
VIFNVLRQTFAIVQALFQFRMGDVTSNNNGAVQRQTGRNRILRKLRQDLTHRAVQVNVYRFTLARFTQLFRDIFARVVFQFFDPDTVAVDLRFNVAIRRTGTPIPTGQDAP